jgi:diacylglycerol kinase family enzyme
VTVERGTAWGSPGRLPDDGVVVHDDRDARAVIEDHRRHNEPLPVLGLLGGDLARTLGGSGDAARLRSSSAMTFSVDVGAALVDGRLHWFVAHLVARRSWWRGRVVAVMNAQWLGRYDLGPRAHPGDGLLDVTDADLSLSDRLKARRRLPVGTHVPHPGIATRRVAAWQTDFDPPLDVWLDGDAIGRTRQLSVRVEPDALTVVV